MNDTVVGYDTERDCDEAMARQMVTDLCHAYPGHAWFVVAKGGVWHIKDMELNDKWGMCLHYSDIKADANDRKKQVVMAAGEFLERARLKRGAKDKNQVVASIEGVPQKHMRPGIQ